MLSSPALCRQRDLFAALSVEVSVAEVALEAHARSIRMEIMEQLRIGTDIANGKSHSAEKPAIIQPAQWLHLELDQSLQNALDVVDGNVVHLELKITRRTKSLLPAQTLICIPTSTARPVGIRK
jgi:hypothetical protein